MTLPRLEPATRTGREVRAMFAGIAGRYDLLNGVLSGGLDRGWRRVAVARVLRSREDPHRPFRSSCTIVDVCCGTGELALQFRAQPAVRRILGVDFVERMVRRARSKGVGAGGAPILWSAADALALPFGDAVADVITIAFGLRNLERPQVGLQECARVLKPGGRLAVLEFFRPPPGVRARAFRVYFRHVLPRLGRLLSGYRGVDAYRYLPESVEAFASAEEVGSWLQGAGLPLLERRSLAFGSVQLLIGEKHGGSEESPPPVW